MLFRLSTISVVVFHLILHGTNKCFYQEPKCNMCTKCKYHVNIMSRNTFRNMS